MPVPSVSHDTRVDWLELNPSGTRLLFRDKRRQLTLFNVLDQDRMTLLNYCNYVQWVPESDVVVGQNRDNLNVWYNIDQPEKVTVYPIKGPSFLHTALHLSSRALALSSYSYNSLNSKSCLAYLIFDSFLIFNFC